MAQAEGNHRSFTTDVDHVMDPFDPRLIGAGRRLSWYISADDAMGVTMDPSAPPDSSDTKGKGNGGQGSPTSTVTNPNVSQGGGADLPMPTDGGDIVHHTQGGGGGSGGGMPGASPATGGGGGGTPVDYTPGSGVSQWKTQVETGLQRNGLPVSLENQVMKQMQTESSGNPNAINRTDSNAVAGHPSQGLMQTIPSTFNQYHLPGDSANINDPQANIDSAIGYAKSTYGPGLMNSQGNGMGSGHGY